MSGLCESCFTLLQAAACPWLPVNTCTGLRIARALCSEAHSSLTHFASTQRLQGSYEQAFANACHVHVVRSCLAMLTTDLAL